MKLTCSKVFSGLLFSSTVVIALVAQGEMAKADSTTKSQEGVVIKTTNMVGKKTIKVPQRQIKKEKPKTVNQNVNYSRGDFSKESGVVAYALKFIGTPYVYGAQGPNAFDCSGLTQYVYKNFGVNLEHYTGSQFRSGLAVPKSELMPGDLVFFNTVSPVGHVGIYIGGGEFIHAPSSGKTVTISSINQSYYSSRYAGARRVLK